MSDREAKAWGKMKSRRCVVQSQAAAWPGLDGSLSPLPSSLSLSRNQSGISPCNGTTLDSISIYS